jgi:hypothetical protein
MPKVNNATLEHSIPACIFKKRYHWQRKLMIESLPPNVQLYLSVNYERIFGHEFFRGEALLHPMNGGVNTLVDPIEGQLDTLEIYHHRIPRKEDPEYRTWLPFSDSHIDDNSENPKKFHNYRKFLWKHRKIQNSYDYFRLHPQIEILDLSGAYMSYLARRFPYWREKQLIKVLGKHTGKLQFGVMPGNFYQALNSCYLSSNPLLAYSHGGYDIITPDPILFGPTMEQIVEVGHFADLELISSIPAAKREIEESECDIPGLPEYPSSFVLDREAVEFATAALQQLENGPPEPTEDSDTSNSATDVELDNLLRPEDFGLHDLSEDDIVSDHVSDDDDRLSDSDESIDSEFLDNLSDLEPDDSAFDF